MFVARVVVSGSRRESWTVVGDDGLLVEPAERFLSFLTDSGRSPNTVKAYAHDLRDWFAFLAGRGLDWSCGHGGGRRRRSWRGCGCRRRLGARRWRCCRSASTARHRRSTASSQRSGRCTSTRARCGVAVHPSLSRVAARRAVGAGLARSCIT